MVGLHMIVSALQTAFRSKRKSRPAIPAPVQFSPEIALLVLCARTSLDDANTARLRDLAGRVDDWRYVVDLAQAHGLMPLLYWNVRHVAEFVPHEIMTALAASFTGNARKNMLLTAEMLRLLHIFEAAPVPVLALKGPVLAQMAYDDLTLRQFIDLDLLIHEADYLAADVLLRAEGYLPTYDLSPTQEAWYVRHHYEREYVHPATNISVDLHWALLPKGFSFASDPTVAWQKSEQVYFDTTPVPCLSPEATLLFLSAHSAKHNWSSLGFLCDMAEVLRSQSTLDWQWVAAHSHSLGSRQMLDLSLSLAHSLLDAPLPPDLARQLEADPTLAAVAADALRLLFREDTDSIVTQFVTGNIYVRTMPTFADKLRYWLNEVAMPTPLEWRVVRLPAPLFGLYYPLRLLRVVAKFLFLSTLKNIIAHFFVRTHRKV